jgi:uncharacterized OB-fold protein
MTFLVAQPSGIPAPHPSPVSMPYWEGCREGVLRLQRCSVCGAVTPKPLRMCRVCHQPTLVWEDSRGAGSLYSWTVVWRPQHPSFVVPYAPAIVTLDEGMRVLSAVVGCDDGDLAPGMRLSVEFHAISDEITLPYFHPD